MLTENDRLLVYLKGISKNRLSLLTNKPKKKGGLQGRPFQNSKTENAVTDDDFSIP